LILWLLASVVSFCAEPRSNFSGAWNLNESATGKTAAGPREIVWKIEHNDPRFKYSLTGKLGDMSFSEAYDFTTDGKTPSAPADVGVCAAWEGGALVLRYVKDGRELARFTLRVSADGKQMTREAAMGNVKIRDVYDRQ
jgi:hypothetical protein